MCQTGQVSYVTLDNSEQETAVETYGVLYHTQTIDGRWICETCYTYDMCAHNHSDPCEGLCGERKCDHRPKLVNNEYTFWTWRTREDIVEEPHYDLEDIIDPIDFYRADGRCICAICNKEYSKHPFSEHESFIGPYWIHAKKAPLL